MKTGEEVLKLISHLTTMQRLELLERLLGTTIIYGMCNRELSHVKVQERLTDMTINISKRIEYYNEHGHILAINIEEKENNNE